MEFDRPIAIAAGTGPIAGYAFPGATRFSDAALRGAGIDSTVVVIDSVCASAAGRCFGQQRVGLMIDWMSVQDEAIVLSFTWWSARPRAKLPPRQSMSGEGAGVLPPGGNDTRGSWAASFARENGTVSFRSFGVVVQTFDPRRP
jgi:hypothetical protein